MRQCRQAAGLLASSPPGWPSAGYIILTLFNRHVSGSQLEQVVWGLLSFPELVRYHVSNCKVGGAGGLWWRAGGLARPG